MTAWKDMQILKSFVVTWMFPRVIRQPLKHRMPVKQNKQSKELDKLLPIMPDKEVADKLNLPLTTVRSHAANRKIKKTYNEWSKNEIMTLKKEYKFGIAWIMDKLPNRTKWAIINKYREVMGLRPDCAERYFSNKLTLLKIPNQR